MAGSCGRVRKTGAVLVAAGLSSRMGDFKPMLPFGESTISRHLVSLLKQMDVSPVIVVTGYRAEELEAHLADTGARFVRNERYQETQMFDSVKIGIQAAAGSGECEQIMILPMDAPAICADTIRRVRSAAGSLVRPVYRKKPGHPIRLSIRAARVICGYKGGGGLRGAMENCGIPIVNLEVGDEWVCRDVDTKEEYEELMQRGNGIAC